MINKPTDDISIVLCGEAGQGIKTIEYVLTKILKDAGLFVFSSKEYMSRIRGGCNSTQIRIADHPIACFIDRIDICIPFIKAAIPHLKKNITKSTLVIGKKEIVETSRRSAVIDFDKLAVDVGGKIYINAIAIGIVIGLLQLKRENYKRFFPDYFSKAQVKKNIEAADKGYEFGVTLGKKLNIKLMPKELVKKQRLSNGSDAIALAAIAADCNFISSYPMSPSTGVLTNLAAYSQKYDIIVEQTEDEISAINMALGAWYAGARALVTTSGGGFALMTEGMSLAGMTETPVVIHLGQRPGPATGLPTRSEQGDLNLVLYAGHGEFPRIIFTPGTIEQAFTLTQKAFNLADKYQIPVIILTDQYLLESYYMVNNDNLKIIKPEKYIHKTQKNYQRYKLTNNGISPRGIPGFGTGLVSADSDEHTEAGYITEDFDTRIKMVEKRLKKFKAMEKDIIMPEFVGNKNYKYLIVSWGSNYHVIKEAFNILSKSNIGFLHFSQVFPLHKKIIKYFNDAEKIIVVENNATGQFASLLKQQLDIKIHSTILKFNGLPFSVEEMVKLLIKNMDRKS